MTNTTNNVTNNATLMDSLIYNNRFATAKLTAEQLGAENFAQWKALILNLHRAAYTIYTQCENSGMKVSDKSVDKTEVFNGIRAILNSIGEVNEHKMYANEESAIAIIGYAGKRGNDDSPELQFCNSKISNRRAEITKAKNINGYSQELIDKMEEELASLIEEKKTLLATADMRIKKPTITSGNAFRLDVEHFIARQIVGQMAKSLEELDKEEEERKARRKASAKARKQAKANA